MLRERTAQRKLDFSAPGRDLVSILVSSACSQALQGALSGVPGHPWRPFGRSRGAPGTLRDAPETLPRRLRDVLGHHGVYGEGPGSDFQSILGPPEVSLGINFRSIFTVIFDRFCERVGQRTAKLSTVRCSDRHTLRSKKARRRGSD